MEQSILIGPVSGLPFDDSVQYILTDILSEVPDIDKLLGKISDSFFHNDSKGIILISVKPQEIGNIDDLFIPLARRTQIVSAGRTPPIPCRKVDKNIELGDNDGDLPFTPKMGPGNGPNRLYASAKPPQPVIDGEVALAGIPTVSWIGRTDSRFASERTSARR